MRDKLRKLAAVPIWKWPGKILIYFTQPVPPGLWIINVLFQRVLRINAEYPWMINFTSRVVGEVHIGKNVWKSFAVSGGCYIQGWNKIFLGDDCLFAPGVKIISANHDCNDLSKSTLSKPIEIENGCWLGANAIILPGVKLGAKSVVAAGAVVSRSFPPGSVIAGVPAKLLRAIDCKGSE